MIPSDCGSLTHSERIGASCRLAMDGVRPTVMATGMTSGGSGCRNGYTMLRRRSIDARSRHQQLLLGRLQAQRHRLLEELQPVRVLNGLLLAEEILKMAVLPDECLHRRTEGWRQTSGEVVIPLSLDEWISRGRLTRRQCRLGRCRLAQVEAPPGRRLPCEVHRILSGRQAREMWLRREADQIIIDRFDPGEG